MLNKKPISVLLGMPQILCQTGNKKIHLVVIGEVETQTHKKVWNHRFHRLHRRLSSPSFLC